MVFNYRLRATRFTIMQRNSWAMLLIYISVLRIAVHDLNLAVYERQHLDHVENSTRLSLLLNTVRS